MCSACADSDVNAAFEAVLWHAIVVEWRRAVGRIRARDVGHVCHMLGRCDVCLWDVDQSAAVKLCYIAY